MTDTIVRYFRSYRALPAISGRSFLPISFFGRMPTTIAPLAILTFTTQTTGSYAVAGLAATATAIGTAVGAPVMGRLADRCGQRPVLSAAIVINAGALTAMALLPSLTRAALLTLCAVVGLSLPQVGGMARARWLALTRRHAGTAMAYEGTADEVAYVLGPATAGLLASLWGAPSALLAAALAAIVATGAFAVHPTHAATVPARPRHAPDRLRGNTSGADAAGRVASDGPEPGLARLMLVPILGMLLMGAFFAADQSALTAYAVSIGRPTAAGLIYALMAVGSAVTALATAALPERIGPTRRCAASAVGLLFGVLLMAAAAVTSAPIALLGLAVLVTGLSVGPMLVTLNQVAGALAPIRRGATAMAYLSAGAVIGIGLGATGAGALADVAGSPGAFAVSAAASGLLLGLALIGLRPSGRRPLEAVA